MHSPTPTRAASFTATSSRPTCCWDVGARRGSRCAAWRRGFGWRTGESRGFETPGGRTGGRAATRRPSSSRGVSRDRGPISTPCRSSRAGSLPRGRRVGKTGSMRCATPIPAADRASLPMLPSHSRSWMAPLSPARWSRRGPTTPRPRPCSRPWAGFARPAWFACPVLRFPKLDLFATPDGRAFPSWMRGWGSLRFENPSSSAATRSAIASGRR